jgi:hypothetical protein
MYSSLMYVHKTAPVFFKKKGITPIEKSRGPLTRRFNLHKLNVPTHTHPADAEQGPTAGACLLYVFSELKHFRLGSSVE